MRLSKSEKAPPGRLRHSYCRQFFLSAVLLLLLLELLPTRADTVRVTSWNLGGSTNRSSIAAAANELERLGPEVILLQNVRGWAMCSELAERLRPSQYFVCVCSSFSGRSASADSQVAILSRQKPYFSWAQEVDQQSGWGFVFAAISVKGQRLGFFSVAATRDGPGVVLRPLLDQAKTASAWEANRVQSFIVSLSSDEPRLEMAGPSPIARILEEEGYADALAVLSATNFDLTIRRQIQYRLLVQSSIFPASPGISRTPGFPFPALTCDIELDPVRIGAGWTQRARELEKVASEKLEQVQPHPTGPGPAQTQEQVKTPETLKLIVFASMAGAAATGLAGGWLWLRSRKQRLPRTPALLPQSTTAPLTTSYTIVLTSPETSSAQVMHMQPDTRANIGVIDAFGTAEKTREALQTGIADRLRGWVKQTFIARILGDREKLLNAQQDATIKALKVDERLARIEKQIQQQTESYQARIDELTQELLAAREENRELIRTRINQVKLEMEAVRARVMAAATQEKE